MNGKWTLTIRDGPHVAHKRFQTLAKAIDAMEHELDEMAPSTKRRSIHVPGRSFDAARQVAIRAEVTGPGGFMSTAPRGGVDMRGDGSTEAYTGRLRRKLVELQTGETPYAGLLRALGDATG
jgi:hypothetical protein